MAQHLRRRLGKSARGQALVEFTLVVPVLLVLVMGIVDFAWGMRAYVTITNAVREGARVGVVCGGGSATTWSAAQTPIQNATVSKSNGLLTTGNVTVSPSSGNCTTGDEVSVNAAYDYSYITPIGGLIRLLSVNSLPAKIHMSSTTKMRAE